MDERRKTQARAAIGLLTATRDGGDPLGTTVEDYQRHMTEAAHMLADLPPGDADLKQRFVLLLGVIADSTEALRDTVAGTLTLATILLDHLSVATGREPGELLTELALGLG